jgi:glycerol-3-phosphate O-acyltransferase / dihydroxyacetone phosphate acyltransferase
MVGSAGKRCIVLGWQEICSGRKNALLILIVLWLCLRRASYVFSLARRSPDILCTSLVDLFSTKDATPNYTSTRRHLLEYYSLLQSTHLTNSVLTPLQLPVALSPTHPTPLPSRLFTLSILIRDTVVALVRLPTFFLPLLLHMPVYVIGRLAARLAEHEEESQAQNKVVFSLLLLMLIYPATFWVLWAVLSYSSTGALVAALMVWAFAYYHTRLVNGGFDYSCSPHTLYLLLIGSTIRSLAGH